MKRPIITAFTAFAIHLALTLAPVSAETVITPVLTTPIEGMPDTEAKVLLFDVDPGWKTDHHIHPGQLFVYILEGGLRLEVDGAEPVDYAAGEAFYELPDLGMTGANLSATERAKFVVFQFGEAGSPLMVAQ
ncbi:MULTISPECIES: cupin domain-containing protein [Falsihalocynthiibacter]|uniref:cupin domain-containing protein n=1 Tax=Falsihalocynthiibacter TaxID=2854182 RepID=UPI0030039F67